MPYSVSLLARTMLHLQLFCGQGPYVAWALTYMGSTYLIGLVAPFRTATRSGTLKTGRNNVHQARQCDFATLNALSSVCKLSVEREVKMRRRLKAETADPESISDTDL